MVDNSAVVQYFITAMTETTTKATHERVAELIEKGLTVLEVARHLNISPQAVYKHMHRRDIQLPSERAS